MAEESFVKGSFLQSATPSERLRAYAHDGLVDMTEKLLVTDHIAESRFGIWFLNTETWEQHVLKRAISDLARLVPDRRSPHPVILDIGCGSGRSFKLLDEFFRPSRMIGIDSDSAMLAISADTAATCGLPVEFRNDSAAKLSLPDASVDMVFCHQTFHHLIAQQAALGEFFRVLRPGGILLMAESTRRYIHSWIIRLLFRHDMTVQRSAQEYLDMIRAAGFTIDSAAISYPYLWWSRSDFGILERIFGIQPPKMREETLINLVAQRP